jgi:hypothetical protein
LSYPRCRASNRRDGERETRYLPGVTIFLIPRASSKSAHRLKGFECSAALMEGSLDAIERIVDNSNGLSDGRVTSHRASYISSQVEFSTISAETMIQLQAARRGSCMGNHDLG